MYGYRKPQQLPLSDKDKQEKTRRFEFVQGLVMSTIFDDDLWLELQPVKPMDMELEQEQEQEQDLYKYDEEGVQLDCYGVVVTRFQGSVCIYYLSIYLVNVI